jgi:hypothetical protein
MRSTSTLSQRPPAGRNRRLTRPLAVVALVAAFATATTSAAQAQTISNSDRAGDMVSIDFETGATTPAPDQTRSDVIRTRMRHGAHRVSVRVEFAELQRVSDGNLLFIQMVTNEGARRIVTLEAGPGDWGGHTEFTRADERLVRCAVRHSIDYSQNVMTVSFPRRCASRPAWVKFRVAAAGFDENGFHLDDALRDQPMTDADNDFVQSRRVYRSAS